MGVFVYIIGIAGGSGSGKTTFAKKVQDIVGCNEAIMLSMDSYYLHKLPEELKTASGKPNFDHPSSWILILANDSLGR